MIVSDRIAEAVGVPQLPVELFDMIHKISTFLILDDAHDIGRFQYSGRRDHWYHGRNNHDHPGFWHHWQIGMMGMIIAEVGAVAVKGMEIMESIRKIETGDFSSVDRDIIDLVEDDNTISLDQYRAEVSGVAPAVVEVVSPRSVNQNANSSEIQTNHVRVYDRATRLVIPKPKYLPAR